MASPVGADRARATAPTAQPGAGAAAGDDGGEEAKGAGLSMKVPVRFKGAGGEEVLVQLNARICTGLKRRQGQQTSHHTLSIELTSDEDLYLLYTLELTESQYVELKREQRLVVGFAEFPGHLVELLQTCARQEEAGFQAQSNAEYRYVAFLAQASPGSPGQFSVVITDRFKRNIYLRLEFQPGTDEAIKAHLAKQMMQQKEANVELSHRWQQACRTVDSLEASVSELRMRAAAAEAEQQAALTRADASSQAGMAAMAAQHAKVVDKLKHEHAGELREATTKFEAERATLTKRVNLLTEEHATLSAAKHRVDSERQSLENKLAATRKDLAAALSQAEAAEGSQRKSDAAAERLQKLVQKLQVANATLEQEVKIKEGLHAHASEMLTAATAKAASLEDTLAMFKSGNQQYREKLEECRQELKKGNTIIARLQDKVRAQKAKLRQREAVLIRQEELIEEKERALFALRQQLAQAQEGTAAAERTCSELRGKLATLGKEHDAATREVKALTATVAHLNDRVTEYEVAAASGGSAVGLGGATGSMPAPRVLGQSFHPTRSPSLADAKRESAGYTRATARLAAPGTGAVPGGGDGATGGAAPKPAWTGSGTTTAAASSASTRVFAAFTTTTGTGHTQQYSSTFPGPRKADPLDHWHGATLSKLGRYNDIGAGTGGGTGGVGGGKTAAWGTLTPGGMGHSSAARPGDPVIRSDGAATSAWRTQPAGGSPGDAPPPSAERSMQSASTLRVSQHRVHDSAYFGAAAMNEHEGARGGAAGGGASVDTAVARDLAVEATYFEKALFGDSLDGDDDDDDANSDGGVESKGMAAGGEGGDGGGGGDSDGVGSHRSSSSRRRRSRGGRTGSSRHRSHRGSGARHSSGTAGGSPSKSTDRRHKPRHSTDG